mmetsp:Transcript_19041/g.16878  ORF Transcript_19041/g.16878 Transcript_19041/m.16878 type:complete len:82 (+) Transcript_19041:834-1079(+)
MPLYGWIYSETVGWHRKRPELKMPKYKYNQKMAEKNLLSNNDLRSDQLKNTLDPDNNLKIQSSKIPLIEDIEVEAEPGQII